MDESQAKLLIKETFQSKFDKLNFIEFIQEFLSGLDRTKSFGPLTGNVIRAAFRDRISSYERIGQYVDPELKKIDVLIVNLNRGTTLQHGRTGLRNFAADYLQSERGIGKAAVLLAYVPYDSDEWRFSFVTLETGLVEDEKGKFKEQIEKITPARRKSFLVGESEKSHTAQSRFVRWIATRSAPTIQEIEDCFDVESVTKEFFIKYKGLFERSRDAILRACEDDSNVRQEFLNIGLSKKEENELGIEIVVPNADDFAKKLLGQIVFLYFLQRKGWFGVKKEWGDGDKRFLRYLFDNRQEYVTGNRKRKECNFFNDILEPLFYEALAYPRERDYSKQFDCKIPFLNGGLFEPLYGYDWQRYDLLLPDALFSNDAKTKEGDIGDGILDVFDRYNFTVNESEPLETEVAVDPEMLGKVFENLLPENERKGKGTYYTPRSIVAYMCQQSLIEYLATHLKEDTVSREDVETLVIYGERIADFEANWNKANKDKELPKGIRENARKIDNYLADIKVCDPAIGSGAFPVGMMQEVVRARLTLASIETMPEQTAYQLKRHAIENSLYGVDIDSGAVEIAKLRLWLSLVVDEEDRKIVRPLPNLDFKIIQGDSLIDEFRGIQLFDDSVLQRAETHNPQKFKDELKKEINEKQQEFFSLHRQGDAAALKRRVVEKEIIALTAQLEAITSEGKDGRADKESLLSGSDKPSVASLRLTELREIHQAIVQETQGEKKVELRKRADRLEHDFVSEHLREVGKELEEAIKKQQIELDDETENVRSKMKADVTTPKISKLHKRIATLETKLTKLGDTQSELAGMDFSKFKPFFLWHLHFFEVFQERGGFDVMIANPPYLKIQHIEDDIAKVLKSKYLTATGKFDLYVIFVEQSFRLLNTDGVMLFIHPHRFLTTDYGSGFKKFLDEIRGLRSAILFGIEQIFETATTYTGIFEYTFNSSDILVKEVNSREFQNIAFNRKRYSADAGHWLSLSGNDATSDFVASLSSHPNKLVDIFKGIYQGIVTVGDDIFAMRGVVSGVIARCHSEATGKEIEIEAAIMKPLLKGEDIKRYKIPHGDLLVLYPHYTNAKNKTVPYEESELKRRFPLAYRYISQFKTQLIDKKIRYKTNPKYWYSLHRAREITIFEDDKIITPYLQNSPNFTFDNAQWLTNTKGYVLVRKVDSSFEYKFLLGVLNSSILWYFIKQTSSSFSGNFYEFTTNSLGRFSVPSCSKENQACISKLADYVIYAKGHIDENESHDALMTGYFEQVINALVYELYLTDEIHKAEKYFFDPLEKEKLPAIEEIEGDKLVEIRRIFERLFDRNHIIRQNIFFLDTIESVRIIEGKV